MKKKILTILRVVPSLAILVLLIPVMGTGVPPALVIKANRQVQVCIETP